MTNSTIINCKVNSPQNELRICVSHSISVDEMWNNNNRMTTTYTSMSMHLLLITFDDLYYRPNNNIKSSAFTPIKFNSNSVKFK